MSAVIETFIICDVQESPKCHKSYGVDNRARAAKDHRQRARVEGWHYINGEDICPECYAVGRGSRYELS